jgi:hypothetical protein
MYEIAKLQHELREFLRAMDPHAAAFILPRVDRLAEIAHQASGNQARPR